MRCCTSNCAAFMSVPYWNHTVTSDAPCLLVDSTRSTPGAADTARSMGWVMAFSMSSGPAPV